jgi:plasmid replication initiation protein
MNVSFTYGIPKYRKIIFEEHKIKPLNEEDCTTPQQFFKHLVENLKNRPLYVSAFVWKDMYKEYSDKMYFTGLTFKYSPKPFNNLAVLRDNVENKFLLDFLKQSFHNDYAQSAVNQMNASYLPAFLQLYKHYKQTGEKDKAKKIKELATTVAQNSGVTECLNDFEK